MRHFSNTYMYDGHKQHDMDTARIRTLAPVRQLSEAVVAEMRAGLGWTEGDVL